MASRISSFIAAACVAAGALALATPAAFAQYKWIGADGRVNYSDLPPPGDHRTLLRAPGSPAAARAEPSRDDGEVRLPYALRTATEKYPVVLYTSNGCDPCEQARAHLAQRGVPYTEKRVRTQADTKAFEALGFESAHFPSISVGRDKMVGFEASAWGRMLDAAGYPKSSMLPSNYAARPVEDMRADSDAGARRGVASAGRGAARADARAEARADAADAADATRAGAASRDGDSLLLPATYDAPANPIRF